MVEAAIQLVSFLVYILCVMVFVDPLSYWLGFWLHTLFCGTSHLVKVSINIIMRVYFRVPIICNHISLASPSCARCIISQ